MINFIESSIIHKEDEFKKENFYEDEIIMVEDQIPSIEYEYKKNIDYNNNCEKPNKIYKDKIINTNDCPVKLCKYYPPNKEKIKKSSIEENKLINNSENELFSSSINSKNLLKDYEIKNQNPKNRSIIKKKIIGFLVLFFSVILIVLSSILTKRIENNLKPFLFTYLNYNFFIIYLVIDLIKKLIKNYQKKKIIKSLKESEDEYFKIKNEIYDDSKFSETMRRFDSEVKLSYANNFAIFSLILSLLWYFSNAFYNYGLNFSSITTVNSVSSSDIVFVLILEYLFLVKVKERKNFITVYKILAVLFSLTGISLIYFYNHDPKKLNIDSSKNNSSDIVLNDNEIIDSNKIIGIISSLMGAIFYSSYSVYFKIQTKKYKSNFDIIQIFGFIGLFNFFVIPILLIFLHIFKIETFELPSGEDFLNIFINALFGVVISDFLNSYAIILLNPDVVSFGLLMTIPISYIFDIFIIKTINFNLFYFFGISFIACGFFFIAIESYINARNKSKKKENNKEEISDDKLIKISE